MLRIVLILVTVFAAIGAGTVGAVFAGYNAYKSQLPDASTVTNMEPQIDTDVYDAANNLIEVFHNSGYRHIHVDLSAVSPLFKEAIVAVEDHNFYTEGSWDLARLAESGFADITHSSSTIQGGSTITEQLAKISLYGGADPPQSIDYKIKEIVLGNEIQLNFSKNQILEMYINRIFYGNFAVGVGSAAELYFLKPASQLDLAQAAMLAGLPQSPTSYNPLTHSRQGRRQPARQEPAEAGAAGDGREPLRHADGGRGGVRRTADLPLVDAVEPESRSRLRLVPRGLPQRAFPAVRESRRIHHPHDAEPEGPEPRVQRPCTTPVAANRKSKNMNDGALVSLDPQTGRHPGDGRHLELLRPGLRPGEHGGHARTARFDDQALHVHGRDRIDQVHDDDADPRRLLHVPDPGQPQGIPAARR